MGPVTSSNWSVPRSAVPSAAVNDRRSLSARGLWLGVALTIVSLAGFAIFAAWTTQVRVTAAQHVEQLQQAMVDARFAVASEESLERKYRLEPAPDILELHRAAGQSLVEALQRARAIGDANEVAFVDAVLFDHARYLD